MKTNFINSVFQRSNIRVYSALRKTQIVIYAILQLLLFAGCEVEPESINLWADNEPNANDYYFLTDYYLHDVYYNSISSNSYGDERLEFRGEENRLSLTKDKKYHIDMVIDIVTNGQEIKKYTLHEKGTISFTETHVLDSYYFREFYVYDGYMIFTSEGGRQWGGSFHADNWYSLSLRLNYNTVSGDYIDAVWSEAYDAN